MAGIDGGHLLVKALKREGVDTIFGLSGNQIQSIFDGCIDEEVRIIDTRHEQGAVHMAEAWARVTGQPGVALVTAGPGVVDAVPGTASAFQSASPVVIIGGRTPLQEFDLGFGQDFQQAELMRSITKWGATCYDARRIPEYVATAFRQARSGRPGPAYLDVPGDILETQVEESEVAFPNPARTEARPQGDPVLVERAVEMLLKAERPLVIAGSGIWWSQAGAELQQLVETARIPLTLRQMARGCVPEDHPLCSGPLFAGSREADVVLLVGCRVNFWMNYGRPPLFGENQRWIQVDIDASEIGRNHPIEIGIVGDARAVLGQMTALARLSPRRVSTESWVKLCQGYVRDRRQRLEAELTSEKMPIHPLRLCREIADFVDREAVLVMDGGDIAIWGATVLRAYVPGGWLDNGSMGLLGSGVPFGIAAKLARPDKQVLVLSGDGSFGLNGMEYDTAIRHHIPLVTVIGNDGAWGMIKHRQQTIYGRDRVVGTELGFTRYDRMVEALGGYGEYVEEPGQIRPALERAFASGLPACVNVKIDPDVMTSATRRTSARRGREAG